MGLGFVESPRLEALECRYIDVESTLAVDRLLNEQHAGKEALESRRGLPAPPQIKQSIQVVILLVAVERDVVGRIDAVQYRGDLEQALQIALHRACEL